jgi:hypothetical protein
VLHLVNPDTGLEQQNFIMCVDCFVKATKGKVQFSDAGGKIVSEGESNFELMF